MPAQCTGSSMSWTHRWMRTSPLFATASHVELVGMRTTDSAFQSSSAPPQKTTNPSQWVAVGVLTVATFLVVTSEMLPVGVLTPMAEGLGISSGATGVSLTITGLVSAVTAPVVPRLLGNLDRKKVLASAMAVLAVGNLLTMVASGFALLVVSRVILGVGMGTVWGMASAVATRLVAPQNIALAVSFAVSGVASASVLGVPLGTFVGNAFGWRAAFGALAALALVLCCGAYLSFDARPLRILRARQSSGDPFFVRQFSLDLWSSCSWSPLTSPRTPMCVRHSRSCRRCPRTPLPCCFCCTACSV